MINIYKSRKKIAAIEWKGTHVSTEKILEFIELFIGKRPSKYTVFYNNLHDAEELQIGNIKMRVGTYLLSHNAGPSPEDFLEVMNKTLLDKFYSIDLYDVSSEDLIDAGSVLPNN